MSTDYYNGASGGYTLHPTDGVRVPTAYLSDYNTARAGGMTVQQALDSLPAPPGMDGNAAALPSWLSEVEDLVNDFVADHTYSPAHIYYPGYNNRYIPETLESLNPGFLGWPKFGNTFDARILFQHALTTEPTAANLGFTYKEYRGSGNSPTFNANGMLSKDSNSVDASLRFTGNNWTTSQRSQFKAAGYIEYWLNLTNVGKEANPYPSGGAYDWNGLDGVGNQFGAIYFRAGSTLDSGGKTAYSVNPDGTIKLGATQNASVVTVDRTYVPIRFAWENLGTSNGKSWLNVDGLNMTGTTDTASYNTILLNDFRLGGNWGNAGTTQNLAYRKNLIIGINPPKPVLHPLLHKIALFGDSMVTGADINTAPADCLWWARILRACHMAGVAPGNDVIVSQNGGHYVASNWSNSNLMSKVSPTSLVSSPWALATATPPNGGTYIAATDPMQAGPTVMWARWFTNDLGRYKYGTFDYAYCLAEAKLLVARVMGVDGIYPQTLKRLYIPLPLPRSDLYNNEQAARAFTLVRKLIQSLADWWNTTYGATIGGDGNSLYGRVMVGADLYAAVGSPSDYQWSSHTSDGIHTNTLGNKVVGDADAQMFLNEIL